MKKKKEINKMKSNSDKLSEDVEEEDKKVSSEGSQDNAQTLNEKNKLNENNYVSDN